MLLRSRKRPRRLKRPCRRLTVVDVPTALAVDIGTAAAPGDAATVGAIRSHRILIP